MSKYTQNGNRQSSRSRIGDLFFGFADSIGDAKRIRNEYYRNKYNAPR